LVPFFDIMSKPPMVFYYPVVNPYKSTIVKISSANPHFNLQSYSVFADIDGPPFTYISQGFRTASIMKSYP